MERNRGEIDTTAMREEKREKEMRERWRKEAAGEEGARGSEREEEKTPARDWCADGVRERSGGVTEGPRRDGLMSDSGDGVAVGADGWQVGRADAERRWLPLLASIDFRLISGCVHSPDRSAARTGPTWLTCVRSTGSTCQPATVQRWEYTSRLYRFVTPVAWNSLFVCP